MDELMYGVILMANMENLLSAPPENKSRKPKRFPDVNSRYRDMNPETEDDEHQECEQYAIFEFFVSKNICDHRSHIRSPLLFHLLLRFSAERP